jgi:hypothetical protein
VRLEYFAKQTIPNGLHKALQYQKEQADLIHHQEFVHVEPIPLQISISLTFNSRDYAHC